ncbi:MAG: TRAP transporter small permease [Burkholderiaceae bacterium]|nr:TRAP transporter small permease [Burkholderiaceae bacterium]MCD8517969.1 TRAP transporter small permease [Burkholderiaceae bacterium]MCD8536385.1 TRAP transporter small permease [Burkholderiaceae bacterium]MCD8564872.1 TRAP transporter small permease [Burkholderiaceae bacterium]
MFSKFLDRLFTWSGYLAGIFLVTIAVLVVAQIVARLMNTQIPSADEFAGYSLAASSFLGLAYSFRSGSHIRVTLLTARLSSKTQRVMLLLVLAYAVVMIAIWAYNSLGLVWESYEFKEMSTGIVKYPIWIPQLSMGIGVTLFCLAILEDLVNVIRGKEPNFEKNKEQLVD